MTQGVENDLIDIRYYAEITPVHYIRDNEPFEDINTNTLVVDDKAILARNTAAQAQIDISNHKGIGGISEHANATPSLSGFMSVADKTKLDEIQTGAQLNILAPIDAIELISRNTTTLHSHILATSSNTGFMSASDKVKLDTVSPGAQVNNLSVPAATQLTSGGNADSLHSHNFVITTETFTESVHATHDHSLVPGIAGFPGFIKDPYTLGPLQNGVGVTVFSKTYAVTTLDVVVAGLAKILDHGWWGSKEEFRITDVSKAGVDGIVTYEVAKVGPGGDMDMYCWQGGYGT